MVIFFLNSNLNVAFENYMILTFWFYFRCSKSWAEPLGAVPRGNGHNLPGRPIAGRVWMLWRLGPSRRFCAEHGRSIRRCAGHSLLQHHQRRGKPDCPVSFINLKHAFVKLLPMQAAGIENITMQISFTSFRISSIIKSPGAGVTLCFQFVSAVSAAAKTFPSHVETVWAKPLIFGTKDIWVWGNVLDDLSVTLTQGHGCGIN